MSEGSSTANASTFYTYDNHCQQLRSLLIEKRLFRMEKTEIDTFVQLFIAKLSRHFLKAMTDPTNFRLQFRNLFDRKLREM